MEHSNRHLLLTGVPGIGKTTVLRRVAEGLPGKHLGGFYTEEIRKGGVRQGFRLVDFNGRNQLIAHVDLPKSHQVGKYGVDVKAIDAAADALIPGGFDVYLIDEIGKMESLSRRFIEVVRHLLDSDEIVIATVGKKGFGFIDEVKRRADATLWEITRNNRDGMPEKVIEWLRHLQ